MLVRTLSAGLIALSLLAVLTVSSTSAGTLSQQAKLTVTEPADFDQAGTSVAISGDTVVVGVPRYDVDGNVDQGAAFVYTRPNGGWHDMTQVAMLTASDGFGATGNGDLFGMSVDIDQTTIIVGAPGNDEGTYTNQGAAYIFPMPQYGWEDSTEQSKLLGEAGMSASFGTSVAIKAQTAVVGAPGALGNGAVFVFHGDAGWTGVTPGRLRVENSTDGDALGESVDVDGDTVVAGNIATPPSIDAAYVFEAIANGTTGFEIAKLTPSDGDNTDDEHDDDFGVSVAISGPTIVVGAHLDAITHPDPDPRGVNEDEGSAYVFAREGDWTTTTETAKLVASDGGEVDEFGFSVATTGDRVVVGAYIADVEVSPGVLHVSQGAAYAYDRPQNGWESTNTEDQKLTNEGGAEGDTFGSAVSLANTTIVVGAGGVANNSGAAYVFGTGTRGGSDTEIWGDNDCSGAITVDDAIRDFLVLVKPEGLEDITGCPEMGSTIVVPEPTDGPTGEFAPQGGGPVIWGDVHCTEQIDERDPLAVLYFIAGLPELGHSGFCPEVGASITFTQ